MLTQMASLGIICYNKCLKVWHCANFDDSQLPRGLTAGQQPLKLFILVRIQAGHHDRLHARVYLHSRPQKSSLD